MVNTPSIEPTAEFEPRSGVLLERIKSLHPIAIDLSLGRLQGLLKKLGNPERQLPPVIHIAGTNGKGSVVAHLRAMLAAAGKQVHSYTSPHLVHFHERISVSGAPIAEETLVEILGECEAANDGDPITFFEITTAAAMLAFSRSPADVTLIEVGLGGQFDATNVLETAAVSVITPVDLDHQHFLGDNLAKIGAEKAGIMKPSIPAIVSRQHKEVRTVIEHCAANIGARLFMEGQEWMAYEEHGRLVYQDAFGLLDLPLSKLVGRHQIANAGTAIAALRALNLDTVDPAALSRGLESVVWPGRLQRLEKGPLVDAAPENAEIWLDGAHNPAGAKVLAEALADFEERVSRPLYVITGILETKDATGIIAPLNGLARHLIAVPIPDHERCWAPDILADGARAIGITAETAETVNAAIERITEITEETPRILICGSLYLLGDILKENN